MPQLTDTQTGLRRNGFTEIVRKMKHGLFTAVATAVIGVASVYAAVSVAPEEFREANQWAEAKFEGVFTNVPAVGLVVIANNGPVQINARGGRPLNIAGREYSRGLYCHAVSKVVVQLPAPGKSFSAIAGVDSNDQTSGGRGSVVFLVQAKSRELFRTPLMHEGAAGQSVNVDLGGASQFSIEVSDGGDGISCDQADWAEAKVVLEDGRELWLGDMTLREGVPVPVSTEPPFSFIYDGKSSSELLKTWAVQRSFRMLDRTRTERTLIWTDPQSVLQVHLVAVEYADFPTVEWTVYFKNMGRMDAPILSDVQAVDINLTGTGESEFVLNHNAGDNCSPESYEPKRLTLGPKSQHRFAPAGGRPTSVGFPYFNVERGGEGWIVVIGWPGQWAAEFTRDNGKGLRIKGGQELTRFKLLPGEEVRSPLVAMQFWQGDRVHAQNVWRRWMLAHNSPRDRDNKTIRPILTSCSGGFFPGIRTSEEGECQFIRGFTQAGINLDYWWTDAGWYTCSDWPQIGTWTPDPVRYPHGLKAVSDYAHSNHMGLIVWFEPERVTPGTFLYTNNPSWLLGRDGGQKLLNLGNNDARKWLTDHVDGMLTREGIDFYRQDFNIDPLPYWRANDAADRQGITEIHYIEGYLAWWDELRRRHPGLWIDSCASGGRRNDLETLRRAVPLLRSDYQAFDGNPAFAPGNQGHTYGLASWIPYFGQGVYFTKSQFTYSVRSYLSPAFGMCADVRRTGVDWAVMRKLAGEWRKVAPCMLGDYYTLTPYSRSNDAWIGWQFDRPEEGDGMIQVFRRGESIFRQADLRLRGLEPQKTYVVTNMDTHESVKRKGQELMEQGFVVDIPQRPEAALFSYGVVK
ncbi:MAG: NPCBM/NEW2 domain-containing protein [Limisphaerales bacterium]